MLCEVPVLLVWLFIIQVTEGNTEDVWNVSFVFTGARRKLGTFTSFTEIPPPNIYLAFESQIKFFSDLTLKFSFDDYFFHQPSRNTYFCVWKACTCFTNVNFPCLYHLVPVAMSPVPPSSSGDLAMWWPCWQRTTSGQFSLHCAFPRTEYIVSL